MRLYRIILLVVLALILIRVNQIYHEVKPKELKEITYQSCLDGGLDKQSCKFAIELDEIEDKEWR